ncbi:heat shock protein DnaJ, partial [Bimuria novae-zelandiae CBS 107.79]
MPRRAEPEAVRNYYKDLGVSPEADSATIKRAYRELVLRHHPDKQGDAASFRKVHEAYEVLRDPGKRQWYD